MWLSMSLKMMKFTITTFLIFSSFLTSAQAIDIKEIASVIKPHKQRSEYKAAKNNTNELEYLFSGLFFIYKELFSSQDYMRCTFHPSCSEYGMLAVKKKGAIVGMMATFDRLVRCNGLSPENYEFDFEQLLLIDHP